MFRKIAIGPHVADTQDLPVMRLRLLLLGLPFASGAGLVVHILADAHLPLGIAGLAAVGAIVWLLVLTRLRSRSRALLYQRVRVGAGAGISGTVAYDLARYGIVSLFSMSFEPFHVFGVFGELLIGHGHSPGMLFAVGLLYHLSNGTFFGIAYTLVICRPAWWSGALWGVGLELCMAWLYPSWLRIEMLAEFLQVSAIGHVVYGTVLGTVARWGIVTSPRITA
ncbi:hypothetical protein [Nocardia xishanensis]|uniref:Energy-coupling factor transport system substrate-specific component n=1 Tax=Nocardia xishanensis TaxID=238964 RepID=A0ABW7WYI8_9NOCA